MSKKWTRAEQDLLKKHYNLIPISELEVLVNATAEQIRNQVARLRKCGWTFASKKP